jgi:hypothetical protein
MKQRLTISICPGLKEALLALHAVFQKYRSKLPPKNLCVLVGFDEVQDLVAEAEIPALRRGMSRVFALIERYHSSLCCSTTAEEVQWHLFFPLLSTQGRLDVLTKPEFIRPSSRQGAPVLLSPYLAFPFDVHAAATASDSPSAPSKLSDCEDPGFVRTLGRPLYVFLLTSRSFQSEHVSKD